MATKAKEGKVKEGTAKARVGVPGSLARAPRVHVARVGAEVPQYAPGEKVDEKYLTALAEAVQGVCKPVESHIGTVGLTVGSKTLLVLDHGSTYPMRSGAPGVGTPGRGFGLIPVFGDGKPWCMQLHALESTRSK